jgi:serine/threonine protein kinase
MGHLHANKIVHRDLKPDNVLVRLLSCGHPEAKVSAHSSSFLPPPSRPTHMHMCTYTREHARILAPVTVLPSASLQLTLVTLCMCFSTRSPTLACPGTLMTTRAVP